MAEVDVVYEVVDGIARIVVNRPRKMNSITFSMYDQIEQFCDRSSEDERVRAIVFSGAGNSAFSAGTEIAEFQEFRTSQDGLNYEKRMDRLLTALESCAKPTIAAIAGVCTGGGAVIAACCDLRIAADNVRFGLPIANTLGNCLSMRNYTRLASLIGSARLKNIIFTGRLMEAREGLETGVFCELVRDPEELVLRAKVLAKEAASRAPLTLWATKESLRRLRDASVVSHETDLVEACYGSRDFQEGVDSFLRKRPPQWKGN